MKVKTFTQINAVMTMAVLMSDVLEEKLARGLTHHETATTVRAAAECFTSNILAAIVDNLDQQFEADNSLIQSVHGFGATITNLYDSFTNEEVCNELKEGK